MFGDALFERPDASSHVLSHAETLTAQKCLKVIVGFNAALVVYQTMSVPVVAQLPVSLRSSHWLPPCPFTLSTMRANESILPNRL